MFEPFLAAAVQVTSTDDIEANLQSCAELAAKAVHRGCKLVVLPENFSYLGPETEKVERAEEIATKSEDFLRRAAKEHSIHLIGGGFARPSHVAGKVFNVCSVLDPEGKIIDEYYKIFMFSVDVPGIKVVEGETVTAGNEITVAQCGPLGRIGLSICYDLRFPELYRRLIDHGAHYFVAPAAFTAQTGKDHWLLLLRARAVENLTYVIAAAQTGVHSSARQSYGHAAIIDPWGYVIADAGDEPGLAVAEIDEERIQKARNRLPALSHRRKDIETPQ